MDEPLVRLKDRDIYPDSKEVSQIWAATVVLAPIAIFVLAIVTCILIVRYN